MDLVENVEDQYQRIYSWVELGLDPQEKGEWYNPFDIDGGRRQKILGGHGT